MRLVSSAFYSVKIQLDLDEELLRCLLSRDWNSLIRPNVERILSLLLWNWTIVYQFLKGDSTFCSIFHLTLNDYDLFLESWNISNKSLIFFQEMLGFSFQTSLFLVSQLYCLEIGLAVLGTGDRDPRFLLPPDFE